MDAFDTGYRRYKFLRRRALQAAATAAAAADKDRVRNDAVDNSVTNMGSRCVFHTYHIVSQLCTAIHSPTPSSNHSSAPLHNTDVLGTWSDCWS